MVNVTVNVPKTRLVVGEKKRAILVKAGIAGPKGDTGPKGDKGETGESGTDDTGSPRTLEYTQATPSATWTIPHTFTTNPSVIIQDSAGTVVEGSISYGIGIITLRFAYPFSGTATLR